MNYQQGLRASAAVGLVIASAAAWGADAPPPVQMAQQESSGLQDIVVTARKTEENLQKTPVAVTAVTQQMLIRSQVINVADLQRTAPSLVIATGSASTSGYTFVSIRGEGNLTPLIANDPAVATYIDGVYIARPSQGLTDLNDIARVEVLRGPQGTLFGRNTTGGAVNIISNDPTHFYSVDGLAEVGDHGTRRAGVTVNVPLTDNLAARLTYNFNTHDGFGHNATLDRDVADLTSHFARGKLKYSSGGFSFTLSGDYNHLSDKGQLATLSAYNPNIIAGPLAPFVPPLSAAVHTRDNWYMTYAGPLTRPTGNPLYSSLPAGVQNMYGELPFDKLTAYGVSGTAAIDIGDAKLKSITAYRYSDAAGLLDTDGSAAPALATFGGSRSKAVSEELQLSGSITDRLSYITGGYISRETGYEYSRSQIFGGLLRNSFGTAKNITKGAYAQAYYKLTDTLRLSGGFRYTWDTRDTDLHNTQVLGLDPGMPLATTVSPSGFNCNNANVLAAAPADRAAVAATCDQPQRAKFSYPAWTAGIDWQATPNILVYLKTSGAAKAGGWNIRAGALPAFKPEKVKDIEGGLKADLLNRHLRTNVAAFYSIKSDVQSVVNAVVPGIGVTQYIQNNGDARIWGAEFEVTALPWTGMEVTGNLSLLDGKYKSGSFSEVQQIASATPLAGCAAAGGTNYRCTVDLSGLPLLQLPHRQFGIGATQTLPVGPGDLSLHLDYAFIGSQHYDAVRPADQQPAAVKAQYATENALGRNPGYGLLSGRIGYTLDDPKIEFYLFARNLAGKKYIARRFPDLYRQIGFGTDYVGNPRVYGAGMTVHFGGR